MTSSLIRGRPRRASPSHISVRVVHTLVGGLAGVVWLVLPGMTINAGVPVPDTRAHPPAASASGAARDETSATDLVLPLAVVGAAGVLAGYGYVRRVRRSRTRTTPAAGRLVPAALPDPAELDGRTRVLLTEADDRVRADGEQLGFAEERAGAEAVAPFARALEGAEAELSAAFRMRQRYDDGVPDDDTARRHTLAGIVGRCTEAVRRLDAEREAFDRLRALESDGLGPALEIAEARFRDLTGRTAAAEATVADLTARHGRTATSSVAGHVEQAKDRLVSATTRLNQARQSSDLGEGEQAAQHLRTAEEDIALAASLIDAIDRLDAALTSAASLVPAALTGAEAALAGRRDPGADRVLAAVREDLTTGAYDPLDALRHIVRAVGPPPDGVLSAAAWLVARTSVTAADDFVTTHRGLVGAEARTRLAEARRLLLTDPPAADTLAGQALDLAEQDTHRAAQAPR
ncbi:hypothetical protein ABT052_13390 [Streptomyces sp. NPDC002766]|uniref:hypothetical protein n=1 Tax=unclassified Streptomyces TaxID=2593676 RepID=UPI0033339C60